MSVQEIGIVIDLSKGTFTNTQYKDGALQLMPRMNDGDGKIIYADYGYWESEEILIQDKIASFKNVVRTITATGSASFKIYVKTSNDGFTWGSYILVPANGTVSNAPLKYAKIKIEIFSDKVDSNLYFDKFNDANKYANSFVNDTSNYLELKKDYKEPMVVSNASVGFIGVKTISKSNLKRIDSISLVK